MLLLTSCTPRDAEAIEAGPRAARRRLAGIFASSADLYSSGAGERPSPYLSCVSQLAKSEARLAKRARAPVVFTSIPNVDVESAIQDASTVWRSSPSSQMSLSAPVIVTSISLALAISPRGVCDDALVANSRVLVFGSGEVKKRDLIGAYGRCERTHHVLRKSATMASTRSASTRSPAPVRPSPPLSTSAVLRAILNARAAMPIRSISILLATLAITGPWTTKSNSSRTKGGRAPVRNRRSPALYRVRKRHESSCDCCKLHHD